MPVFIPHTSADDGLASALYRQLRREHDIPCYVENIDYLMNPGEMSRAIVDRMSYCTGMIALATRDSWHTWQPAYSLGVAGNALRLAAVYVTLPPADVPDFLSQWPLLYTSLDVQQFAHCFRRHTTSISPIARATPECAHREAARNACDDFTCRMKIALGQ